MALSQLSVPCAALTRTACGAQIESRPMKDDTVAEALAPGCGQRFRYLYYLDVVSNLADSGMQNAMRHLQACPALVW